MIKFGSVCSGIEAASVAWHPLGWQAAWLSEIEKFPSQVLAHHYPNTPNFGDMTKFKEWSNDSAINVLVGGTPCQSFSVAGLRKGLDDPRGNLMLTYLAIASKYGPQWLVWENVPGVLSSNGGLDFASLLRGMGELGYGFAYRVLDAQYFGVAQRRRRVFVVGYLGNWRPAAAVLFERHSLSGNPAPSREKRESTTATITARTPVSDYDVAGTLDKGTPGRGIGHNGNYDSQVVSVGSLCARTGQSISVQDAAQGHLMPIYGGSDPNTADTVTSKWAKGSGGPAGNECGLFVAQPIATHDVTGTMLSRNTSGGFSNSIDHAAAGYMALQPIALAENTIGRKPENGGNGDGFTEEGPMYTLNATGVHGVAQPIPLDMMNIRGRPSDDGRANRIGRGYGEVGDPMFTITKANHHAVAQPIAFSRNDDGRDATTDLSPTMRVAGRAGGMLGVAQPINIYGGNKRADRPEGGFYVRMDEETTKTLDAASGLNPTCAQGGTAVMQPYLVGSLCARTGQSISVQDADQGHLMAVAQPVTFSNTADCLTAAYGTKWNGNASATNGSLFASQAMAVRRLTPVECERLQGFPDGYTDIKSKGKPTPDGPRYKALGNSMAVPVMGWIGKRIQEIEEILGKSPRK